MQRSLRSAKQGEPLYPPQKLARFVYDTLNSRRLLFIPIYDICTMYRCGLNHQHQCWLPQHTCSSIDGYTWPITFPEVSYILTHIARHSTSDFMNEDRLIRELGLGLVACIVWTQCEITRRHPNFPSMKLLVKKAAVEKTRDAKSEVSLGEEMGRSAEMSPKVRNPAS